MAAAGRQAAGEAEVILETTTTRSTVLRGGGDEVGLWGWQNHGFRLPPDLLEVLDFYADRSLIFAAAAFDDAAAARGQAIGDGTLVHLTIPTDNPWVPLRILGLGGADGESCRGDVYLLTDRPAMLPDPGAVFGLRGLEFDHSAAKHGCAAHRPAATSVRGAE